MAGAVYLVEPVSHLIQTMECLINELSSFDPFSLKVRKFLLRQAASQMKPGLRQQCKRRVGRIGSKRWMDYINFVNGRTSSLFRRWCWARMMFWLSICGEESKQWKLKRMRINLWFCWIVEKSWIDFIRRKRQQRRIKKIRITNEKRKGFYRCTTETEIITSAKTLASIMKKLMTVPRRWCGNSTTINVRTDIVVGGTIGSTRMGHGEVRSVYHQPCQKKYRPLHSVFLEQTVFYHLSSLGYL